MRTIPDGALAKTRSAAKDSEWFSPSRSSFMINYRVDDLAGMLTRLRQNGVEIIQGPESHENGKFAWIMDPDGNKVELWEPKQLGRAEQGAGVIASDRAAIPDAG